MYDKWNKYKLGEIAFVEKNKKHPHRSMFVKSVIDNYDSVIEIGPGEMLEYQQISAHKDVDYAVVDVADLFLNNCEKKFPKVSRIKCAIEDVNWRKAGKIYDVVYVASVIEHTRDVRLALQNMMGLAKNFHFVMFKWSYDGNLTSSYKENKQYWSSLFNIRMLMKEINKHGLIEGAVVVSKSTGKVTDFAKYSKNKSGEHRTGDYLVLKGKTNA